MVMVDDEKGSTTGLPFSGNRERGEQDCRLTKWSWIARVRNREHEERCRFFLRHCCSSEARR